MNTRAQIQYGRDILVHFYPLGTQIGPFGMLFCYKMSIFFNIVKRDTRFKFEIIRILISRIRYHNQMLSDNFSFISLGKM